MTTSISCSWCHALNDIRQQWCKACGHSAFKARMDCDCRKCLGVLFVEAPPARVEALPLPPIRVVRRLLGDAFDADDQVDADDQEGDHV